MFYFRGGMLCGVALAAMLTSGVASAQSGQFPDAPASGTSQADAVNPQGAVVDAGRDEGGPLGDIVVTARKRAAGEVLQDTPLTASAFSGDQLAKSGAVNLSDVGRLTPGVSLQGSNQKGQQNFNIRGIGVNGSTNADEPTVGVITDGVYFATKTGSLGELFDLESVQILRGPQGTLFGRNVTGGAIVIESRRPVFTPEAQASIGYGNGDSKLASLVVNAPLAGDVIAARLGVLYRETDGLYSSNRYDGRFGKEHVWLVRPSVLIKPSDRLDIILRGEWFSITGDTNPTRGIVPSTVPGAVISLPQRDGYVMPSDYYNINADRGLADQDIYFGALQIDWEVAGGVLTSVSGYRQVDNHGIQDYDGTATLAFQTEGYFRQHQASTELRFARQVGDWLSFTVGGFFFHQAFFTRDRRTLDRGASVLATSAQLIDQDSYAAFGEADITITPQLTLTLGGRYSKENKTAALAPYGQCTLDWANCRFGAQRGFDEGNFSPKAGLSYRITDDNMVYGSVTRGFRSGGFSLSVSGPLLAPYLSESATQYEIGTKNDFFDNRLRINASAFYTDYKDIQRVVIGTDPTIGVVTSTFNAASATIKGIELSVNAQVTDWLRLDGVYGYTHARYNEIRGNANPGALRFPRVPEQTGNAGATLNHRFENGGRVELTGSINFTDDYFFDDANTQRQPAFSIVNASLVYRPSSDRYTVTIYGNNLANTGYADFGSYLAARGQNTFVGRPRSYGVRLGVNF